ncbi:TPA: HNH endonuclease [Bacillus cereus]|uniref:ABC-three component system protein n=2 Tax=Bacillus TaxID=1386 RepID=UPI000A3038F7|nr:ABC-three component system protein [Bacillus cereus]MED2679809.1 HNH endonuclease signature motif containing protein [Bacillus thuringiensis]EKS7862439.1 HNH endonuclease [Bacillus cereus]MBL3739808.1 HNH endonuclease [Bacillus cereus]MBL3862569.1 HNH endonuclease [Bacillus cereus]MBR9668853.1 HNH endonuclease [Bacillus cereus]
MSNARRNPTDNEAILLVNEVDNLCPLCSLTLMYEKKGQKKKRYEAAHIYPLNPTKEESETLKNEERLHEDVNHLNNFIALCRSCHKQFDHPRTVEEYRKLFSLKKSIIARNEMRDKYHDYQIETEIKRIIFKLVEDSSEGNLVPLETSALRLDEKANDTLTVLTKRKIRNDINDYYIYIREQFNQLDKEVPDSFELIASQVRTFYLKLKKTESSQKKIYDQLTEWLSKKTENSTEDACGIIISFFIQNCEVF